MIVYVAGQARCGSSLTMAMLAAGGMPVIGTPPDFEVGIANHDDVPRDFLAAHDGHALKVLDPMLTRTPPDLPGLAIWLTRDPLEQAKSHAKFLSAMMGRQMYNRAEIRRLARSLARDEPAQKAAISHCPILTVAFEQLLGRPLIEAQRIATFLLPLRLLDAERMAAIVKPRSPKCSPDLSIEIENARGAA